MVTREMKIIHARNNAEDLYNVKDIKDKNKI